MGEEKGKKLAVETGEGLPTVMNEHRRQRKMRVRE